MGKVVVGFLGTLFFLYVIIAAYNALATGAALAVAILVGGKISGGYFNPAVSIMMTAAGQLPTKELLPYIIAEVLGGLAAFELYKHIKF